MKSVTIDAIEIKAAAVGTPDEGWIDYAADVFFTNADGQRCILSLAGLTPKLFARVHQAQHALYRRYADKFPHQPQADLWNCETKEREILQ